MGVILRGAQDRPRLRCGHAALRPRQLGNGGGKCVPALRSLRDGFGGQWQSELCVRMVILPCDGAHILSDSVSA